MFISKTFLLDRQSNQSVTGYHAPTKRRYACSAILEFVIYKGFELFMWPTLTLSAILTNLWKGKGKSRRIRFTSELVWKE